MEEVFSFEAPNYLENEGNWIPSRKKGSLEFLRRTIYRSKDGELALYFGVNRQYMTLIFERWGKSVEIGGAGIMPKFEDLHKEAVKKFGEEPLTAAAEQRYRRVLGQLAGQHFQEQIYLFQFRFCFVFRQNPILRLNIAWGHFWNGWPCRHY